MNVGIEGYFRLKVFKADGTFTGKDTGWCHNLITNIGMDALATQIDVMDWYHVGTGSTDPAYTDTWLTQFTASSNDVINNVTGVVGTSYGYRRQTIRFDVGTATGNLSECACGWSSTTGTAFMRELIRDGAGVAKTITVLADEFLEFTYELRYYIPAGDFTGVGSIGTDSFNFTMRAASCTSTYWWADRIGLQIKPDTGAFYHYAYTGSIGTIDTVPSGQSGDYTTSITVNSYNPGDHYRTFNYQADTTEWNVAGGYIKSVTAGCTANRWQCEFSHTSTGLGIAKSGANTLVLSFRISWSRAAGS
jgi:hypothetical protein